MIRRFLPAGSAGPSLWFGSAGAAGWLAEAGSAAGPLFLPRPLPRPFVFAAALPELFWGAAASASGAVTAPPGGCCFWRTRRAGAAGSAAALQRVGAPFSKTAEPGGAPNTSEPAAALDRRGASFWNSTAMVNGEEKANPMSTAFWSGSVRLWTKSSSGCNLKILVRTGKIQVVEDFLLLFSTSVKNKSLKTQQSSVQTEQGGLPYLASAKGGPSRAWRISPFAQLSSVASVQPVGPKELRHNSAPPPKKGGRGRVVNILVPPLLPLPHPRPTGCAQELRAVWLRHPARTLLSVGKASF